MSKLLTPKQAAELLEVHPETLRRWETEGKIDSIKTNGGHRRYLEEAVQKLKDGPEPKDLEGVKKEFEQEEKILAFLITGIFIFFLAIYLLFSRSSQFTTVGLVFTTFVVELAMVKIVFNRMKTLDDYPELSFQRYTYSIIILIASLILVMSPLYILTQNKTSATRERDEAYINKTFKINANKAINSASCNTAKTIIIQKTKALDLNRKERTRRAARLDNNGSLTKDYSKNMANMITNIAKEANKQC